VHSLSLYYLGNVAVAALAGLDPRLETVVIHRVHGAEHPASRKELEQIEEYVIFLRNLVRDTTDPDYNFTNVVGYLLCGRLVDTAHVKGRRDILAASRIYVRLYSDLLRTVKKNHADFLERYQQLREARVERREADREVGAITP